MGPPSQGRKKRKGDVMERRKFIWGRQKGAWRVPVWFDSKKEAIPVL